MATKIKNGTNFALLRLLFAALVIFSHTAEIHDGDRSREPLTMVFGTVSFGELAVAAFFIISGYLITGSFLNSKSTLEYIVKRVCRIYPAFVVAFFVCVLIVAPLGGGILTATGVANSSFHGPLYPVLLVVGALTLSQPPANLAFHDTYYPWLNGAMWTIPYEFRCYLLVAVLGVFGLLRKRAILFMATAILLVLCVAMPEVYHPFNAGGDGHSSGSGLSKLLGQLLGEPRTSIRLFAFFMCGALAQLYKDRFRFTQLSVIASVVLLAIGLSTPMLCNVAIATFGGYLILALATTLGKPKYQRFNPRSDISYGLYLYGWPVEKLIFWHFNGIGLIAAGALTIIISAVLGVMSWHLVEKRFVRLAGSLTGTSKTTDRKEYVGSGA